jgi:EAL domain-containing protein (putative c-di-GMP-specific phosphodiesterase class I)
MTRILAQQFDMVAYLADGQYGVTIGAEALMRWRDPAKGAAAPLDFLPVLEQGFVYAPPSSLGTAMDACFGR